VWVGTSTIDEFPLAQEFPNTICVNRGIGGESLGDLRSRLQVGWPDSEISMIVFYGGSADLRRQMQDPRTIGKEYRATIKAIKEIEPRAPLFAIEILSARSPASQDSGVRFQTLREIQRTICAEENVTLVETHRPPLVNNAGQLTTSCSKDRYHLNSAGYHTLATWIRDAAGGLLR
jgi:lysophospholipase L1-like esterase